jgi:hypothetical protein
LHEQDLAGFQRDQIDRALGAGGSDAAVAVELERGTNLVLTAGT